MFNLEIIIVDFPKLNILLEKLIIAVEFIVKRKLELITEERNNSITDFCVVKITTAQSACFEWHIVLVQRLFLGLVFRVSGFCKNKLYAR